MIPDDEPDGVDSFTVRPEMPMVLFMKAYWWPFGLRIRIPGYHVLHLPFGTAQPDLQETRHILSRRRAIALAWELAYESAYAPQEEV